MSQSKRLTPVEQLAWKLLWTWPPLREAVLDVEADWLTHQIKVETALPVVVDRLRHYRQAWQAHPQFEHLRALGLMLPFQQETWAMVALVFRHAPGVGGREYSFVIGALDDLPTAWDWATHTRIGDFVGLSALPDELACDPYRLLLVASTHDGRARGFHARMELKRLLPPKLRKLVSYYRRAKREPKAVYLAAALACNGGVPFLKDDTYGALLEMERANRKAGTLPEWYVCRTKAELWAEQLRAQNATVAAQLAYWIAPEDFYRAVTGQVAPQDVRGLFRRSKDDGGAVQMLLF